MAVGKKDSIYPISVAAKILGIHPRTLRAYEVDGLITPKRQGNKRYYSQDDIDWINCLRHLIHAEKISIPGIKRLLTLTPCWEIKKCPPDIRDNCTAYKNRALPCWERALAACAKGSKCQECEVYINSIKSAKLAPSE